MNIRAYMLLTFLLALSSIVFATENSQTLAPEYLLTQYDRAKAIKVKKMIDAYHQKRAETKKPITEQQMKNVAKAIFDMYGLNPNKINKVTHDGKGSYCSYDGNGRVSINIRGIDAPLKGVFLHEMLHALACNWDIEYGEAVHIGHDGKKRDPRFTDCRNRLQYNIHHCEEINFNPPTPENLLNNYNKREAGVVKKLIDKYKSEKDISDKAITDVARHIFLMYHLDPRLIGNASYGGDESKAVKVTSDKKITCINIYVAKKRSQEIKDIDNAYGNDTFLQEMLHALVYRWVEQYGNTAYVGHGSEDSKEEFEKCRQLLMKAIYASAEQTMLLNNDPNEMEPEEDNEK